MLHDLWVAARMWRRKPWIAALLVATLGVGVTGAVVVFSVADLALWHPLPFRDADRLVSLWSYSPQQHTARPLVQWPAVEGWDERTRLFSAVYAYAVNGVSITGHGEPQAVTASIISSGLFDGLGVRPALGRDFVPEDFDGTAEHAVVISDAVWKSRFGSDPRAIGQALHLDDVPYRIVGVMPPGFSFPVTNVLLWVPLRADARSPGLYVVARLRPGVTVQAAEAATEATTHDLRRPDGRRLPELRMHPFTRRVPQTESVLWALGAAVMLVLFVAIANAAHLLLADAVQRQHEMATRAAIGASMWQLARQLLAEATVIAAVATGVSLCLSAAAMKVLSAALPRAISFQALRPVTIDRRGWIAAVIIAAASTAMAALIPLLRVRYAAENVSRHGGVEGPAHMAVRAAMVAAQIAVTLVVLVSAALLARGFLRLQSADLGYDPRNLLSISVALRGDSFRTDAAKERFIDGWRQAAAAIPGAVDATVTEMVVPPRLPIASGPIETDDGRALAETAAIAQTQIDAAFFRTLRIPLLRGAVPRMAAPGTARREAVVSLGFASLAWPNADAIGRAFRISRADPWYVVVGIAGDVPNGSFEEPLGPLALYELRNPRAPISPFQSMVVRTTGDARGVERAVREVVKRLNPRVPVTEVDTASAIIVGMASRIQFATWLMSAFSAIAAFLALMGVYASFAYLVRHRTREIAVRMALGASARDVFRMIVGASARWALIGVAVGVPLALVAARGLRTLLYGTSPADPLTYGAIVVALVGAAIAASWRPASRASRLDAAEALHAE